MEAPEIYNMPGHYIRRLHQISVSVFADRVARAGHALTPVQFAAISAIASNPGIDQATLSGLIAYDRVTIGGVIDRLEQKGLVRREISERDRRAKVLHLTEIGLDEFEQVKVVVQSLQREVLSGLTPEEQETLLQLMRKAAEAGNKLSRAPLRQPLA
ncbi:MarR family winged helix-turn-helix transcriptional regulator [Actibacterium sp. XHP0104]|uniref:MarR family winged helix-turn-helix transcriptional regulator n=1 Tax=Actibacterium sp. XHP0104 TaxID=2984335 RepID=UPI0021E94257|nr:MarR family transcriptional regulator [Actibacterium sp. XHP0104]MCV2880808.1 MarR family transcriptional regulator [Actibacterium sp. XHP0104]